MKKYKKHYFLKNRRNKNLKQNILDKLHRLFDGITDAIKVTYYASKSQEIMKFEMLGHNITEENGVIRIIDDSDIRFFTPKTVIIVVFVLYIFLRQKPQKNKKQQHISGYRRLRRGTARR